MGLIHDEDEMTMNPEWVLRSLRVADKLRATGKNWGELAQLYRELSGEFAYMESMATDEFYRVEDAYCKGLDEVNASHDENAWAHRIAALKALDMLGV